MNKNASLKEKRDSFNPKSKKKILISIIMVSVAFLGSFFLYFMLQISLNTETPVVVVISGSMSPNINKGDLLFVQGRNPSEIRNGSAIDQDGDVIVFNAWDLSGWPAAPRDPIVHRVIDKRLIGDVWYFQTKGDANPVEDPVEIPEDRIYGVVIGGIPFIGWVKIILTDTGLIIPLLVIVSALLILSIVWDIMKGEDEDLEEIEESTPKNK